VLIEKASSADPDAAITSEIADFIIPFL